MTSQFRLHQNSLICRSLQKVQALHRFSGFQESLSKLLKFFTPTYTTTICHFLIDEIVIFNHF